MSRPLAVVRREYLAARRKMERASERRRSLPPGSSRARVTTANAKWATACEAHERLYHEYKEAALAADAPRRTVVAIVEHELVDMAEMGMRGMIPRYPEETPWDGARRDIAAVTDRQRAIFDANDATRRSRS